MKTVVLQEPGVLVVREAPEPASPAPGYALVRVLQVGMCGGDLHAYRGSQTYFTYPRIIGHEMAVKVIALGQTEATHVSVGDRATVEPYLNCGHCLPCRQGRTNCCTTLRTLGVHVDGGLQEMLLVPIDKLHPSATLSVDALTLVEPLCIGQHAVVRAALAPGEWSLVIGAGPIGQAVAIAAQAAGARVMLMEMSPRRLAHCAAHLAVDHLVDARSDPLAAVTRLTAGDLPTAVFDCTGSTRSMNAAFEYVAHGGRLILVGHNPGDVTFSDPLFHGREMTLLASRNATAEDSRQVMARLERDGLDVAAWITDRVPPEGMAAAFRRWLDPESGSIKPVVVVSA